MRLPLSQHSFDFSSFLIFVDIFPCKIRPLFKFNLSKLKSFAHHMYLGMAPSFVGPVYPINSSNFQAINQEKARIYEIPSHVGAYQMYALFLIANN